MSPDKLVHQANQVGRFFAGQPQTDAAAAVAAHLRKFWEPRMRREIIAHLEAGGAGLDPAARKAVESLRDGK